MVMFVAATFNNLQCVLRVLLINSKPTNNEFDLIQIIIFLYASCAHTDEKLGIGFL